MKRFNFGIYQFNQAVGAVVLLCLALFVGAMVNAGLLKDWFQTSLTLRIILPESGVAGLAHGAEVQVMGTRAGEIRRIVIDPAQRMYAEARIEAQMRPFIRRDSTVVIRRQFGIAGPAFIDVARGTGEPLDWGFAVVTAAIDRAPTDTISQVVVDLQARVLPLLEEVRKAAASFTALMDSGRELSGPLGRTFESAAAVTQRVQNGEGPLGKLLGDEKMAADLQIALADALSAMAHTNSMMAELERTSKDARIPLIIQRTEAVLASLQASARNIAAASPQIGQITTNAATSTEAIPSVLLQAQTSARELELLLGQMRRSWLLGGSGSAPPPSRRAPASEVRP